MEKIGEGGNWIVYRVNVEGQNMVFRIPKRNLGNKVALYIKKYRLIKDIGLPTLETCSEYSIKNEEGILTEDLNFKKERIYVTHNSLYSDSKKELDRLSNIT